MKAAIYLRVSTEEQAQASHVSIRAQREACRAYCEREGFVVLEEIEDSESGLETERAGYQRLLAFGRERSIDAVVVYHFDRFSRDPAEAIFALRNLERMGVSIRSATSDTDDPFVRGLYFLLAEQESRRISQRVRSALRSLAKQGKWIGTPPFGYDLVKAPDGSGMTLQPNADASWIRRIFSLCVNENLSIRSLTLQLTSERMIVEGHQPRRTHVYNILRNPAYIGKVQAFKHSGGYFSDCRSRSESEWVIADGLHPPLVDEATFEAAQEKLRSRRFNTGNRRRSDGYLLTGLIRCGRCGGRMHAHRRDSHSHSYVYYRCYNAVEKGICDAPYASGLKLHAEVKQALRSLPITPEARERAAELVRQEIEHRDAAVAGQRKHLQAAKAKHERDRVIATREYLRKRDTETPIPDDVYHTILREADEALASIDAELSAMSQECEPPDIASGLAVLDGMTWDGLSDQEWEQVVRRLVKRVEVHRQAIRVELHEPLASLEYSQTVHEVDS
jgi:site-specific DNA recombinase